MLPIVTGRDTAFFLCGTVKSKLSSDSGSVVMITASVLLLELLEGTRLVLAVGVVGGTHFDEDEDMLELLPVATFAAVDRVSADILFLGVGRMLKRRLLCPTYVPSALEGSPPTVSTSLSLSYETSPRKAAWILDGKNEIEAIFDAALAPLATFDSVGGLDPVFFSLGASSSLSEYSASAFISLSI